MYLVVISGGNEWEGCEAWRRHPDSRREGDGVNLLAVALSLALGAVLKRESIVSGRLPFTVVAVRA